MNAQNIAIAWDSSSQSSESSVLVSLTPSGGDVLFDRGNPLVGELCEASLARRNEKAAEMFRAGISKKLIGQAFGVTGTAVSKWLKKSGVSIPKSKQTPETEARKAECIRMHVELDYGASAISKRMNMNKALVQKWLKKAGVYKVGGRTSRPIDPSKCGRPASPEVAARKAEEKRLRLERKQRLASPFKTCIECKETKHVSEFFKQTNGKTHCSRCKICHNRKTALYKSLNPEKTRLYLRKWREKNADKVKEKAFIYYRKRNGLPENHPTRVITTEQRAHAKIAKQIRRTFNDWVNNAKDHHYTYLAGCTRGFLRHWIGKKFKKGMSWSDRTTWQIDHIIPVAKFDLNTREGRAKCFHYTNLQPLWNADNRAKSDKVTPTQPELCIPIQPPLYLRKEHRICA